MLTGGEWRLPLACSCHASSHLSLTARIVPSQSHPHRSHNLPHANRLPTRQQRIHNTTSRSCFRAGLNRCFFFFFFSFFPLSSCAPLPGPNNPCASLCAHTPRIGSAHAIASLDKHHPLYPPPNHATTEPLRRRLYATLAPLCMPALKPHTCMTHARPWRLAFLWGLEPVSPLFFFLLLLFFLFSFFFFSVLCVCAPFQHASGHHPHAPPPSPGQMAKQRCHHKVSMMATTCTHIMCTPRP